MLVKGPIKLSWMRQPYPITACPRMVDPTTRVPAPKGIEFRPSVYCLLGPQLRGKDAESML